MYIRSVRLADLMHHRRLSQHLVQLNRPESAVSGLSPFAVSLRSWLPGAAGLRTFILGDEQPRALIQVAPRNHRHVWDIIALGAEVVPPGPEGWDDPAHPWLLLLHSTAVVAGRRRVTRLLARLPDEEPALACFRQAGFQPYGREFIYCRAFAPGDRLAETDEGLRPQRPGDAWAIHRLYFQTAPRPTQDAEAHTSNHWELRRSHWDGMREHGWLLEEGTETLAYTHALSHRRIHLVEWLFGPAQRDRLPRLLRQTLAQLPAAPGDLVYWRLPEYQTEAEAALITAGFTRHTTQTLMVKFMAVKVAARERTFAPVRARARRGRAATSFFRRTGHP